MTILFYQLNGKFRELESWKSGKYFGHTLFGATHFNKHGIDVNMFKVGKTDAFFAKLAKYIRVDFRLVYHAFKILFSQGAYDIVYAPYPRGLQLLILFRSIGLFRKPIVIFGHRTLENPKNKIVKGLIKQFYKGVDKVLFFGNVHLTESIETGVASANKLFKINWGPDLDFYDNAIKEAVTEDTHEFYTSIGKSRRDYLTLIKAFIGKQSKLKLYVDNVKLENELRVDDENIDVSFLAVTTSSPYDIVQRLSRAKAVTICSQKVKGLNGITNLYEAMAMRRPVIITKNKYIDIDVEREQIGIAVEVGDVEGWKTAIDFFDNNPDKVIEFGNRGRALCEREYNLEKFTGEVAAILNGK